MRHPCLALSLLLALAACREAAEAPVAAGDTEARLRRGLVSVSEEQMPAYALDWRPPQVLLAADDPEAAHERARAALADGHLYEDAEAAIPIFLVLLRQHPDDAEAAAGLQAAITALLAEGDAVLSGLGEAGSDIAPAHRIAAVARTVAAGSPEVQAYLDRVDSADRIAALIERGEQYLAAGQLGENGLGALSAFAEVERARPGDARARQGLLAVEAVMLRRAQQAVAADDYAVAGYWLAAAQKVRPAEPWAVEEARRQVRLRREARVAEIHAEILRILDDPHAFGALKLAQARIDEMAAIAERGDWRVARSRERLELASRYGRHRPGQRFADALESGGRGPPMQVVPHGRFMMGAKPEEPDSGKAEWPQHEVQLQRGFAIARTETTVADFARFIAATGYRTRAERRGYSVVYDERSGNFVLRNDIHWRHGYTGLRAAPNMPVLHVDVRDAEAYAEWLSAQTGKRYRLPYEAEFEYALRAGGSSRYPWGEAAPPRQAGNLTGGEDRSPTGRRWGNAFAGYGDGHWGPAPAARFRANAFGLHDLEGNVSEWVMDCWHQGYRRAPADGGPWYNPGCRTRVVRGASWSSSPAQARSAWRMSQAHDVTNARTGFRVVRDI